MSATIRPPDPAPPPRGPLGDLGGVLADLGPAAQAVVPGAYAWIVTVAPLAFARGAPTAARLAAVAALVALAGAPVLEARRPALARLVSVWGFSLDSAIVWVVAGGVGGLRLETARAVAGMLGWALFALASAAPSPRRDPEAAERIVAGAGLRPRARVGIGDMAIVLGGVAMAAALQLLGWGAPTPERHLLVRLVALAAGVALIGAATRLALAVHAAPPAVSPRRRMRAALPWLVALGGLLAIALARLVTR